jgi:hypothetical protein
VNELNQPATKADLLALEERLREAIREAVRDALTRMPLDDEPYTEDQQRRDVEANARIERGEGIDHEEILKEFGL